MAENKWVEKISCFGKRLILTEPGSNQDRIITRDTLNIREVVPNTVNYSI